MKTFGNTWKPGAPTSDVGLFPIDGKRKLVVGVGLNTDFGVLVEAVVVASVFNSLELFGCVDLFLVILERLARGRGLQLAA